MPAEVKVELDDSELSKLAFQRSAPGDTFCRVRRRDEWRRRAELHLVASRLRKLQEVQAEQAAAYVTCNGVRGGE